MTQVSGRHVMLGSSGPPEFFINGLNLKGAKPLKTFKEVIDKELADKKKA